MAAELPSGFLVLPRAGDSTLAQLSRKLRLLALRRLLIGTLSPPQQPLSAALNRLQGYLQQLARDKIGGKALLQAVGELDVLVPLLCVDSGQLPLATALAQVVPSLLLSLSQRLPPRTVRETLLWDVPVASLIDQATAQAYHFEPSAQGLVFDGHQLEVRTAAGADHSWRALRQSLVADLDDSIVASPAGYPLYPERPLPQLALVDTNPLSMLEEHPHKHGNRVDLGERTAADWSATLRQAFELIELALPGLHRELIEQLQRIVPVGFQPEQHLSASYREAPGLIYLSLHPSLLTMAEAIIHECQHGKLNTLRWFDPILHNGDSSWSPSPVRPDMRPLMGVLLGVHAFVPVAALHLRLAELGHPISEGPAFEQRRSEVLAGNRDGLATLARLAQPTASGERVLAALNELHACALAASCPPDAI